MKKISFEEMLQAPVGTIYRQFGEYFQKTEQSPEDLESKTRFAFVSLGGDLGYSWEAQLEELHINEDQGYLVLEAEDLQNLLGAIMFAVSVQASIKAQPISYDKAAKIIKGEK